MIALLQQMARVFNATPICASKETGRLQVTRTGLTKKLQPRRRPAIAERQLTVLELNATSMSASKFKETGQPLARVSTMSKDASPRTAQIASTQPRGDIMVMSHRVTWTFNATPTYASKESETGGLPRVIVTRLRKLALLRAPQIP
jgi:hypothetical protein